MKKLIKNKDSKENREFWKFVEKTAKQVSKWPAWKKAGWNVK